jgi:hypothetical protein
MAPDFRSTRLTRNTAGRVRLDSEGMLSRGFNSCRLAYARRNGAVRRFLYIWGPGRLNYLPLRALL